jgi:hypothetical protein
MAVNNLNTPGVGIQPSLIDAKGDLLVGTANDAIDRLGVTGTTGAVLTADAGETTGLKWAAAGSVGGLVHIETVTVGSGVSSVSVDDVFSADYDAYELHIKIIGSTGAGIQLRTRVGGADLTASDYNRQNGSFSSTTAAGARLSNQTTTRVGDTNTMSTLNKVTIYNVFATSPTFLMATQARFGGGSLTNPEIDFFYSNVNNNTSYAGFTLFPTSGTYSSGTITIYGYQK